MKKKIVSALLCGAMAASLMAAAASAESTTEAATESAASEVDMSVLKGLTVGFAQCDNANSWRIAETDSMQKEAEKYGVNFIYTDASGDIATQASNIEDLVAQGIDYLVVPPQEEDGLQAATIAAMQAGIPVILIDRSMNGEPGTEYTMQIMSDFVWEAQQVADYFIKDSGGKGNIVILEGTQGATSTLDRQSGFVDQIEANSEMKIIADQVADYVMDKAQEVMENILQAQGDEVDYVFCHNDDMALGAIKAIEAAGYVPGKDIKVAGIDGPKAAMEAILAGKQLCSCTCSPLFGPVVFETIARMEAGEEVPTSMINEDTLYDINNATVEAGF